MKKPPQNDPRLVELCTLGARLFPGHRFFMAFVPLGEDKHFSSMANMPEDAQIVFLRILLSSLESGRARRCEILSLEGAPVSCAICGAPLVQETDKLSCPAGCGHTPWPPK